MKEEAPAPIVVRNLAFIVWSLPIATISTFYWLCDCGPVNRHVSKLRFDLDQVNRLAGLDGMDAKNAHAVMECPLTVKLRGRAPTSDRGRGPTISPGPRGLKQTTPHGPLQRLLEVTVFTRAQPRSK